MPKQFIATMRECGHLCSYRYEDDKQAKSFRAGGPKDLCCECATVPQAKRCANCRELPSQPTTCPDI